MAVSDPARHLAPAGGAQVVLPQACDLDRRTRGLQVWPSRPDRTKLGRDAGRSAPWTTKCARASTSCGRGKSKRSEMRCACRRIQIVNAITSPIMVTKPTNRNTRLGHTLIPSSHTNGSRALGGRGIYGLV